MAGYHVEMDYKPVTVYKRIRVELISGVFSVKIKNASTFGKTPREPAYFITVSHIYNTMTYNTCLRRWTFSPRPATSNKSEKCAVEWRAGPHLKSHCEQNHLQSGGPFWLFLNFEYWPKTGVKRATPRYYISSPIMRPAGRLVTAAIINDANSCLSFVQSGD